MKEAKLSGVGRDFVAQFVLYLLRSMLVVEFVIFGVFFCVVFFFVVRCLTVKLRGTNSAREGSRKRAAKSADVKRLSKAVRIGALCEMRRLGHIPVTCWQNMGDKEVEARQLVTVRDLKDGAVRSFV